MDPFRALSAPTRRGIVEMLAHRGQLSASDIGHSFKVSAPAVSQHLKILLNADLVEMEKDGQRRLYRLNPDAMADLEDWARKTRHEWTGRFDALNSVLRSESDHHKNHNHHKYHEGKIHR
ncbi:MAG: winged helix-turn-helix transcriptional regulator [Patescibacteria group bacterium]|nr:winged helix-turn-helix transcriptional regulator [Patescibacteria group bacterium]